MATLTNEQRETTVVTAATAATNGVAPTAYVILAL